jgi:hypothetical protein
MRPTLVFTVYKRQAILLVSGYMYMHGNKHAEKLQWNVNYF